MARTSTARRRQEPSRLTHRQRELEWIETHSEEMRRLAGEWVALEGEELIAHGKDAARVFDLAQRKGITVPFVFFVEPEDTQPSTRFSL